MATLRRIAPCLMTLVVLAARAKVEAAGTVTGVSAAPSPASAGAEVAVTVAGTGPCQVYLDFGDKQKAAHLKQLPGTVKHVYARPGTYVIKTFTYTSGNQPPGLSRCGGFADMELVVKAAAASRSLVPASRQIKTVAGAPPGVGKVSNPAPSAGGAEAEPIGTVRASGGTATPTPTPARPK